MRGIVKLKDGRTKGVRRMAFSWGHRRAQPITDARAGTLADTPADVRSDADAAADARAGPKGPKRSNKTRREKTQSVLMTPGRPRALLGSLKVRHKPLVASAVGSRAEEDLGFHMRHSASKSKSARTAASEKKN